MRGNAWQITAIIAIILVVVLIIPLVIMGRERQNLVGTADAAKKDREETARKAGTLEGEVKVLKTLIGKPEAEPAAPVSPDDANKQRKDIMDRVLPGENDSTRSYYNAIVTLREDLIREREAHAETEKKRTQLQSNFNNIEDKFKAVVAAVTDELQRTKNDLANEQVQLINTKGEYDKKFSEAQNRHNETLSQSEWKRHELEDRTVQLENANRDIYQANVTLNEMLTDVRNPQVEYPAGKIISVNQQAGLAVINLGSADGLLVRTMFSVYHSSITGISFRTAPVGRDPIYCDVCKREVSRDVSKASIEVMQILGPHKAEVRILDDILIDPIMVGDVVYSPIWRPGQKLRFALTAGMHLPGSSISSGNEAIKRLIEANGGEVDCWINENAEGEELLEGSISELTNFIVINEKVARSLDPEVARVQEELLEHARNRAVKKISLGDLLHRMGWRNPTPVHIFGSDSFTKEMIVVPPQQQGIIRPSSGTVSPLFTPDNAGSRVDARDAAPVRSSPGIVSPLFDSNASPTPSSSGRTSELFRSRSPN
jgi:hypothetical protein